LVNTSKNIKVGEMCTTFHLIRAASALANLQKKLHNQSAVEPVERDSAKISFPVK
jgi:hypothetical protein